MSVYNNNNYYYYYYYYYRYTTTTMPEWRCLEHEWLVHSVQTVALVVETTSV